MLATEGPAMLPLCGPKEFDALVEGMVNDFAPRMFAIVQEYGERVDGRIVAWGMAFEDHAQVVDTSGSMHMATRSADDALRGFARGRNVTPRLVWVNPTATPPPRDVGE